MEKIKADNTSTAICGLLGIAFIVLKLCGVINWSWWWVLSPFWIPLAISIVILGVIIVFAVGTVRYKRR